jgi:hypothetical protein
LVDSNGGVLVEITNRRTLRIHCADSLRLVVLERVAEAFIEFQGDNRLGKLIEISSQDVGSIVHGVPGPVQTFAIPIRRVERDFKLFDTFFTSRKTKDAFHVGR